MFLLVRKVESHQKSIVSFKSPTSMVVCHHAFPFDRPRLLEGVSLREPMRHALQVDSDVLLAEYCVVDAHFR